MFILDGRSNDINIRQTFTIKYLVCLPCPGHYTHLQIDKQIVR